MKKLIIPLLLLSLVGCNRSIYRSRVNPTYKPLSAFKSDTLTIQAADTADYINYNFVLNKDKYIGKRFKYFIKDIRINVHNAFAMPIYFDRSHSEDVDLRFYDTTFEHKGVVYYVVISFNEKFNYKEFDNLQKQSNYLWTNLQFEFLKNLTIKNIVLGDSRTWKR